MKKHLLNRDSYKRFYIEETRVKLRPLRDFFRRMRGSLGLLPKTFRTFSRHPRYLRVEREIASLGLQRILDVGCGVGMVSTLIGYRLGVHVTGVDLSPTNVAKAEVLCWVRSVSYHISAAEDIGRFAPPASFDCILLLEILEHVMDVEETIAAVTPLLAPGGHVLITLPNDEKAHEQSPQHVREFDPEKIQLTFGHFPGFHYEELPAVPGSYAGGYFVQFAPII